MIFTVLPTISYSKSCAPEAEVEVAADDVAEGVVEAVVVGEVVVVVVEVVAGDAEVVVVDVEVVAVDGVVDATPVVVDVVVDVEAEVVGDVEVVVDVVGAASVAVVAADDVGAAGVVDSVGEGIAESVAGSKGAVTVTVIGPLGVELVGAPALKQLHDAEPTNIHTVRAIPISDLVFNIANVSLLRTTCCHSTLKTGSWQ